MSVHNTIISPVSQRVFPSPSVRRMPLKSNITELQGYKASAPKENRGMIQHLIDLYSSKKIPNYRTVENAVSRLSLKTKHK